MTSPAPTALSDPDPAPDHGARTLTVRAALFDMDGTLVDSAAVVERTWRGFAQRFGLDPAAILQVSHGLPTAQTVRRFAPSGVDVEAETQRVIASEVEDLDGIVAVPGALQVLTALPAGRWAVVTSASRELAIRRMAAAGLPVPAVLVSADDVTEGKPSPQGYRIAAAQLGVAPSATVVFEDAAPGLLAGRAAGARTVVVGDLTGPATDGLARVPDLTGIGVDRSPDGQLSLRLPVPSGPSNRNDDNRRLR
jgi:HAD superfamily hydrolase (TIGR01509 family)